MEIMKLSQKIREWSFKKEDKSKKCLERLKTKKTILGYHWWHEGGFSGVAAPWMETETQHCKYHRVGGDCWVFEQSVQHMARTNQNRHHLESWNQVLKVPVGLGFNSLVAELGGPRVMTPVRRCSGMTVDIPQYHNNHCSCICASHCISAPWIKLLQWILQNSYIPSARKGALTNPKSLPFPRPMTH